MCFFPFITWIHEEEEGLFPNCIPTKTLRASQKLANFTQNIISNLSEDIQKSLSEKQIMLAKLDFKAIFPYSPSKSLALKWPKNMLVQTLKREKQTIKKR